MTSPSAAHTGIVAPVVAVPVELLVDAGAATRCPACGPYASPVYVEPPVGLVTARRLVDTTDCVRCGGAGMDPFHGCTFLAGTDPLTGSPTEPCACTDLCRVWALNRHGYVVAPTPETTT